MKNFISISLLVSLLFATTLIHAQNTEVRQVDGKTVKLVQYMIRKGDYVIAIAKRFHVSAKEIIKINHFKNRDKVIYAGRKLWIPVAVKEKIWTPESAPVFNSFLTKEDAKPMEEFQIDMDSLDDEIKDDFVTTNEMDADSIQRQRILNHIHKIEKQIAYLQYRLDSIKQADFSFQFNESDKNSILQKMKLARDRFYSTGPIGLQIDSLNELKTHLGEENGRIKSRLSEYEYLQENTNYFKKTKEEMKNHSAIVIEPGSQIANESNYLNKSLTKKVTKKQANAYSANETAKEQAELKEKEIQEPTESILKNGKVAPSISEGAIAKANPELIIDTIAQNYQKANDNTKEIVIQKQPEENLIKPRRVDTIVALPNNTFENELKTNEQKKLGLNNNFIRSQGNKPYVVAPSTTKETNQVASQNTAIDNKNVNINKQSPYPKSSEMNVEPSIYRRLDTINSIKNKSTATSINSDTSHFEMAIKIDSNILKPKPEKVSDDPLATYKTDSNFIMKTVVIKDITFTDYRNRPKYLTPVDSVHRIKAEFFLILARKALAKPDFKEGEKLLRKSLDLNPNYAQAWMLHADLYAATGAPEKALKEYSISSEIDSTNPKVFYNMALLFGKANNMDKAYQCYSKALDINATYLLAYLGRAALLIDQRDYMGAIDDYDKVTAINRYYSLAFKGRGLAKMEAHNFEGAIQDFNQYLEIEDPDGYILYQRGISKVLTNQLLQGCLDFSSSFELGFKQADKAIKKFCQ